MGQETRVEAGHSGLLHDVVLAGSVRLGNLGDVEARLPVGLDVRHGAHCLHNRNLSI